jgi:hypothetical protein
VAGTRWRYARGRERFRALDLHAVYQQINLESFGGQLADVDILWDDLSSKHIIGETWLDENDDHPVSMKIDRAANQTEDDVREVIFHEACHVAWSSLKDSPHHDTCCLILYGVPNNTTIGMQLFFGDQRGEEIHVAEPPLQSH